MSEFKSYVKKFVSSSLLLLPNSRCLFRIVNSSLLVHILIVTNNFLIHLLIFILLSYLEVSILWVCSPIRSLTLFNPFEFFSFSLPWFLLSLWSNPMINLWEEVWLESSIHDVHPVPRHVLTRSQVLTSINLHNLSCYLWCTKL